MATVARAGRGSDAVVRHREHARRRPIRFPRPFFETADRRRAARSVALVDSTPAHVARALCPPTLFLSVSSSPLCSTHLPFGSVSARPRSRVVHRLPGYFGPFRPTPRAVVARAHPNAPGVAHQGPSPPGETQPCFFGRRGHIRRSAAVPHSPSAAR